MTFLGREGEGARLHVPALTTTVFQYFFLLSFSGRLESTNNEVNVLKNNLSKLETNHNSFIIEGEDQLRKEKDKHDQKYR